MKEMRSRIPNVNFTYYVDVHVIENIHTALGVPLGRGVGAEEVGGGAGRGEEAEEEEEEVESDVEEDY